MKKHFTALGIVLLVAALGFALEVGITPRSLASRQVMTEISVKACLHCGGDLRTSPSVRNVCPARPADINLRIRSALPHMRRRMQPQIFTSLLFV